MVRVSDRRSESIREEGGGGKDAKMTVPRVSATNLEMQNKRK